MTYLELINKLRREEGKEEISPRYIVDYCKANRLTGCDVLEEFGVDEYNEGVVRRFMQHFNCAGMRCAEFTCIPKFLEEQIPCELLTS